MNYSSQKSPRPFRRSCRLQPVATRSSAWGFCNTLHEGNEIFQTFGDRLFRCSLWSSSNHSSIRKPISRTRSRSRRSSAKISTLRSQARLVARGMALSIRAAHHSHVERQLDGPIYETRTPQGRTRLGEFSRHATDLLVTDERRRRRSESCR
jgi:hypothetical protein